MKILLVDDSRTERGILGSRLIDLGHEVVQAEDGAEALARYAQAKPDLLLMDVEMPRLNGYETAQRLRAEQADWVPIIFLSGRNTPKDMARGIEAGGDDYLFKPVDPVVLSAKMLAMERIARMRHQLIDTSRQLAEANAELAKQAHLDGLTGIANRRLLDARLADEVSAEKQSAGPLSVLLADVDHFKAYNDHYGHLAGDRCLQLIARCLRKSLRRSCDLVARYGGEEFCVLLPGMSQAEALELAECMRRTVLERNIPHARGCDADVVTLSLGLAVREEQPEAGELLLRRADEALYRAKQQGRNRVCV